MYDKETIAKTYRGLKDSQLTDLASKPAELDPESIPILQEELEKRGFAAEVESLNEYLYGDPADQSPTEEEIKAEVTERLSMGESMESIYREMKERNIDLMQGVEDDFNQTESMWQFIHDQKLARNSDASVVEHTSEEFGIAKEDAQEMVQVYKKSGNWNILKAWLLIGVIALIVLYMYVFHIEVWMSNIKFLMTLLSVAIGWMVLGYLKKRN